MYGAAVSQMSSWLCQKYAGTLYWLFSRLDHIPSKSCEKPKINCVSAACIVFFFWVALRTALRYTPDIHMEKKKGMFSSIRLLPEDIVQLSFQIIF